ncbi:MAG: aldehyde dehydrogenase family protein [Gammaproteobacteria bacterium]|nr:aldehyde dehydrogenase family protein [Gammaproteobacteria bacterium]
MIERLKAGATVLSPDGTAFAVDEELAAAFEPGDRLVATRQAGLLRIPAAEARRADAAVTAASDAFGAMNAVNDDAIVGFYAEASAQLEDDAVWNSIAEINAEDVLRAQARGRSTTRLVVSNAMRGKMIEGLKGWAEMPSTRGSVLETIAHDGFRVELVGAALGPVAFVFEGRPNVLADACGVLRGGNTVVFRIGSDALQTAQAIMRQVVRPALAEAGLPAGAVSLVDSAAHAAGWALFLDPRLALAVARGSGAAVELLGALARSAGTPVSLHGTGGAWMVVSESASTRSLREAVMRSLDRKVCNTLNTCCVLGANPQEHVATVLDALAAAGEARGQSFRLHVADGGRHLVPEPMFTTPVRVMRAEGEVTEMQADMLAADALGHEWEWEETPEVTLTTAATLDEAIAAFNAQSPRLVGTLVSDDADEHERFWRTLDAPFVGDGHTRWVDGQYALGKPELGLSNWQGGRLFARGGVLTGDSVFTVRTRYITT